MSRSSTFYPAPQEFSAVISVQSYSGRATWAVLSEEIADQFGCEPDELRITDWAWLDGSRYADFVELNGRVIGSLNERLTPAEWTEFHSTRVPDGEQLIRDVIAAARARQRAA